MSQHDRRTWPWILLSAMGGFFAGMAVARRRLALGVLGLMFVAGAGFYALQSWNKPLFDPASGEPMFRYARGTDGRIVLFPKTTLYDPDSRAQLALLTQEVAREYRRQQGKQSPQDALAAVRRSPPSISRLDPLVENNFWGLAVRLYWCGRRDEGLVCVFSVSAPASPVARGKIHIMKRGSRIVDIDGREYFPVRVEFGDSFTEEEDSFRLRVWKGGASADAELSSGVTVSGRLIFNDVPPGVEVIQALSVRMSGNLVAWWNAPWGSRSPTLEEMRQTPGESEMCELRDFRVDAWKEKKAR